jgi:hypothetical protein
MNWALLLLALLPTSLFAQSWLAEPGADFQARKATFDQWYNSEATPFKVRGWKSTARELWFNESRTPRDGSDPQTGARATAAHLSTLLSQGQAASNKTDDGGNWSRLGSATSWSLPWAGRINCIAMDPFNVSHLYVGTPDGGIWETYDGGASSWTPKSDFLGAIGVSAIAIDPVKPQTMYIATGDADSDGAGVTSDSRSIGVLKSVDGGSNWNTTGLNWAVQSPTKISRLIIDASNRFNLLAATGAGIQRTTDGGASWTVTQLGNFRDLYQDENYTNIWYAATTTAFYKSTTGGSSWFATGTGLPTSNVARIAIAGTISDPNYIYAHVVGANNNGATLGLYRSTNAGASFTLRSTTNLAGWAGTYNLVLAVARLDREKVYAGGYELFKSTNGGLNWGANINADVDYHALRLYGASGLWSCADHGLYYSSNEGASWSPRNAQLHNFQHYRLGVAQNANHIVASGLQDNGGHYYLGGNWTWPVGGDGTAAAVDPLAPGTAYIASYGEISRTTNYGSSWTSYINSAIPWEPRFWLLPIETAPNTTGQVYCGYTNLYRSYDSGSTWSPISSWPITNQNDAIVNFAVSPATTKYIYVVKRDQVFRTKNAGYSWTDVTTGLDNGVYMYHNVFAHQNDPSSAWVVVSGYDAAHKVYRTTNAGDTWTNISVGLPNISMNAGVHIPGTSGDIFVAADDGVYHYNAATATWSPYRINLPHAICTDIAINQTINTLYVSTFGRGVWTTPIVFGTREASPVLGPVAGSEASMHLYPNPSQGDWQLSYQLGTAKQGQLRLYNAEGRLLGKWRLDASSGNFRSDLPGLATGLYILRLDAGGTQLSTRLVVE